MVAKRKLKVHENPVVAKPATVGFLFRITDVRLGCELEFTSLRSSVKFRYVVDAIRTRNRSFDRAYASHRTDEVYLVNKADGKRMSLTAGTLANSVHWEMIA